jgi:ligand-binding sensor domain-containing protein
MWSCGVLVNGCIYLGGQDLMWSSLDRGHSWSSAQMTGTPRCIAVDGSTCWTITDRGAVDGATADLFRAEIGTDDWHKVHAFEDISQVHGIDVKHGRVAFTTGSGGRPRVVVFDLSTSETKEYSFDCDVVLDVCFDAQNRIWLTTDEGLLRFDGNSWKRIFTPPDDS